MTALFCIASLLLLTIGGIMLARGWWPRYRGEEPRCGNCDYLLIGLSSERCPECGGEINEQTIVRGQRKRRAWLAGSGLLLGLIGAAMLALIAINLESGIDWYSIKPTWLVIRDLQANDPRAFDELNRRDRNKSLSIGQISQIADVAIQRQTAAVFGMNDGDLLRFAAAHFADLSTTQQQKMLQQCLQTLPLQVRPIVVVPDQVPWQISHLTRMPQGWWASYDSTGASMDGKKILAGGGGGASGGDGGGGTNSSSLPCTQPGEHQLEFVWHIEIHDGPFGQPAVGKLLYKEDRKLAAKFNVVNSADGPAIKLLDDQALGQQIRAAITPTSFMYGRSGDRRIEGQIAMQTMPANVAFNVTVRFGGQEFSLGSIHLNKGSATDYSVTCYDHLPDSVPDKVDVILRSNAAVARDTVDQTEIWKGELIYHDVPIQHSPDLTKTGKSK